MDSYEELIASSFFIHFFLSYASARSLILLGKQKHVFSLFDLVPPFHQITIDMDTIALVSFCTPPPACSSGSSRVRHATGKQRCARVSCQGHRRGHQKKGLDRVAAYLDDVIVSYPDRASNIVNIRFTLERQNENLAIFSRREQLLASPVPLSTAGASPLPTPTRLPSSPTCPYRGTPCRQ